MSATITLPAWITVTESKVVKIRFKGKKEKKPKRTDAKAKGGEKKKKKSGGGVVTLGVKIMMGDGSWWFFHYKYRSWTKHWPLVQATNRQGKPAFDGDKPIMLPERTERYGQWSKVEKDWEKTVYGPLLLNALLSAVESAEVNEAAKRKAA